MTDLLAKVRWDRVLLAGVATHVANVVVAVLLIVVYTILAVGPQRAERGHHRSARQPGPSWLVPILTLFAAAWAARKAKPATAALHGLLVGFLVAVIFGLLYFASFDLWGLVLFTLMIVAGLVGGLIGRADRN
jgi:hypothetical protein